MKRFIRTILATMLGVIMLSGAASAQVITNTGPGSNNEITAKSSFNCDVKSTNSASISNSTSQTSSSGSATTSGNTSGGNATSGNASNSSSISTSVTAQNSNPCVPAKDKPTPSKPGGGMGAGGGVGAGEEAVAEVGGRGAGEAELVASLPATGSTALAEYALGGLAVLSAVAALGYAARQYMIKTN